MTARGKRVAKAKRVAPVNIHKASPRPEGPT